MYIPSVNIHISHNINCTNHINTSTMPTFTWGVQKVPVKSFALKNRQGSDLTTGFMFTCPTDLVALPGFRKGEVFCETKIGVIFFLNKVDTCFMFFSFFLCI